MQVTGATWRAVMRILAGVGDLVQRTGDGHTGRVLGGRVIERSGNTVHMEMRSAGFLIEPQNQGRQFSPVWPQNRWRWILRFGPQNWQLRFGDLGLKITAAVSWFEPQNQADFDLSVVPPK
jgi:hypothetical protein